MKLIIVESPTKCETIKKYLGNEYNVIASYGHIRDLSTTGKGGLGFNIEEDFKPTYVINKDKIKKQKIILETNSIFNIIEKMNKSSSKIKMPINNFLFILLLLTNPILFFL